MGEAAATSLEEVRMEMMKLQKALPPRPSLNDLEMALSSISRINHSLSPQLHHLSHLPRPLDCPPPVFQAFLDMHKELLLHLAHLQKLPFESLLQLEQRHRLYDSWIQQAFLSFSDNAFPTSTTTPILKDAHRATAKPASDPEWDGESVRFSSPPEDLPDTPHRLSKSSPAGRSDSLSSFARSLSWSSVPAETQPKHAKPIEEENIKKNTSIPSPEPQNTVQVLSILDRASKQQQKSLDLHGAFLKEIEWVPESLGRLTWLTDLNLSGNRLTILPDSIGDLCNLINLDVSANQLVAIPESLGRLTCLETLNFENNKIEELPWTIGQCTALLELSAGFNQLKALPEATGKLTNLRRLSVHLNSLNSLPTTVSSMTSLIDLDAHFNQLESIPESLCLVTTLTRLDVASNFTDLKELPQHIGKLQKLKVLNVSYNHLTVLPASFAQLTNLQDLQLEGNPLRIPPLHIAQQGKEAVLKYMADHVASKGKGKKKMPKRSFLSRLLCTCGTHFPYEMEAM